MIWLRWLIVRWLDGPLQTIITRRILMYDELLRQDGRIPESSAGRRIRTSE